MKTADKFLQQVILRYDQKTGEVVVDFNCPHVGQSPFAFLESLTSRLRENYGVDLMEIAGNDLRVFRDADALGKNKKGGVNG